MADKPMDLESWVARANTAQQRMSAAQSRLAEAELTGTSGNGAVSLVLSTGGELRAIRISPGAADDLDALQRLIMDAHAKAHAAMQQMTDDFMQPFTQMINDLGKFGS